MRRIFWLHARTSHISTFQKNPAKSGLFCPKTCEIAIASRTPKKGRTQEHRKHVSKVISHSHHTPGCVRACVCVKIYFHKSQFEHFYIKVDRLKVRKFQNENMKSSHCPKYERKKFWNFHTFTWVLKKCHSLTLNVNFQFQESSESFWK